MAQPALFDAETDDAEAEPEAKPISHARARKGEPKPGPPAKPGIAEPQTYGSTWVERWAVQDTLTKDIGTVPSDELYRVLRGCLYVFDPAELIRIAEHMLLILEMTDERDGDSADDTPRTGGVGGTDATGSEAVFPVADNPEPGTLEATGTAG